MHTSLETIPYTIKNERLETCAKVTSDSKDKYQGKNN